MPIFGPISQLSISANVQSELASLRRALEAVSSLYSWLTAYAVADLVAVGYSQADAQSIFNAVTDANELNVLYNGGGLGTYTLPYNFSASQRIIIGP
jgi:hypothetical protein